MFNSVNKFQQIEAREKHNVVMQYNIDFDSQGFFYKVVIDDDIYFWPFFFSLLGLIYIPMIPLNATLFMICSQNPYNCSSFLYFAKLVFPKLFLYYVVCVILCILLPSHGLSDHKLKTRTYFTSQCSERISIFNLGSSTSKQKQRES